nr:acidic leucine-rich nuclear phosphoprotein 32 family member E-like [Neodiprion pinetum]
MNGQKRGPSDSLPHSPPRSPTYERVCRGAAHDEEDDKDELTDSDADTLIIDTEQCNDSSAGDDDREFEQNLAGEHHHHLESSPSPTDAEDEEDEEEDEEDEEENEGEAEVEGVWNVGDGDDVRIGSGLLLDQIDQIREMLGDIDRADDDGYYSDEDWCVALH